MSDCLNFGFNDYPMGHYVSMVRAMGEKSGAFKDLNLAYIQYGNRPYRAPDILTHFRKEAARETEEPFHNVDFLCPTITYLGTYLHRRNFSFDYVNLFQREKDLLRMMIRNRFGFRWNSFYRSDHGDEETIELMGEAGCEGVFPGVESGSDSILQKMNKTARCRDYFKAIPLLKKAGILTHANLIIGFPGKTLETFEETLELLETARPDTFRALLWYADPVTPVWQQKERLGSMGSGFNWSHSTMDSVTAIDLVDKMFLSVKSSVWLPQNEFEQWRLFYLQRRGMSLPRIKNFVRCFNEIIMVKLLNPQVEEAPPELVAKLWRSCLFDDPDYDSFALEELWKAEGYRSAERFWSAEIRGHEPLATWASESFMTEPVRSEVYLERETVDLAAWTFRRQPTSIMLAGFAVLVSGMTGTEDLVMVAGLSGASNDWQSFPIRVRTQFDSGFQDFLAEVDRKVEACLSHAAYGLHFFGNSVRMQCLGAAGKPPLDIGFGYCNCAGQFESALNRYPATAAGLGFWCEVLPAARGWKLSLVSQYDFEKETLMEMGTFLEAVFEEVTKDRDVCLDRCGNWWVDGQEKIPETTTAVGEVFRF